MKYNVEAINYSDIKGHATFEDGCVKVIKRYGNENKYDSIQVFANHWRFIEDKPKELLNSAVITFIKHSLFVNHIKYDQVECIHFEDLRSYCIMTIQPANCVSLDIEFKENLIDFNLIEDGREYTLEDLGIKYYN